VEAASRRLFSGPLGGETPLPLWGTSGETPQPLWGPRDYLAG